MKGLVLDPSFPVCSVLNENVCVAETLPTECVVEGFDFPECVDGDLPMDSSTILSGIPELADWVFASLTALFSEIRNDIVSFENENTWIFAGLFVLCLAWVGAALFSKSEKRTAKKPSTKSVRPRTRKVDN